jgi:hypothetical protein
MAEPVVFTPERLKELAEYEQGKSWAKPATWQEWSELARMALAAPKTISTEQIDLMITALASTSENNIKTLFQEHAAANENLIRSVARKFDFKIQEEPNWREFAKQFNFNWEYALRDLFGVPYMTNLAAKYSKLPDRLHLSHSAVIETYSVGDGMIGLTAMMMIGYLLARRGARAVIYSCGERQCKGRLFLLVRENWEELTKRHLWLNNYFELREDGIYSRDEPDWCLTLIKLNKKDDEKIKIEPTDHLMIVAENAQHLTMKAVDTIAKQITTEGNRLLMLYEERKAL